MIHTVVTGQAVIVEVQVRLRFGSLISRNGHLHAHVHAHEFGVLIAGVDIYDELQVALLVDAAGLLNRLIHRRGQFLLPQLRVLGLERHLHNPAHILRIAHVRHILGGQDHGHMAGGRIAFGIGKLAFLKGHVVKEMLINSHHLRIVRKAFLNQFLKRFTIVHCAVKGPGNRGRPGITGCAEGFHDFGLIQVERVFQRGGHARVCFHAVCLGDFHDQIGDVGEAVIPVDIVHVVPQQRGLHVQAGAVRAQRNGGNILSANGKRKPARLLALGQGQRQRVAEVCNRGHCAQVVTRNQGERMPGIGQRRQRKRHGQYQAQQGGYQLAGHNRILLVFSMGFGAFLGWLIQYNASGGRLSSPCQQKP